LSVNDREHNAATNLLAAISPAQIDCNPRQAVPCETKPPVETTSVSGPAGSTVRETGRIIKIQRTVSEIEDERASMRG
jgi:hypothetical protein